jgi:hypothetical protein
MAKTYLQAAEETSNIESENQMERNTHISQGEKNAMSMYEARAVPVKVTRVSSIHRHCNHYLTVFSVFCTLVSLIIMHHTVQFFVLIRK